MRLAAIDYLACPDCYNYPFRLEISSCDRDQVIDGCLICENCKSTFNIKDRTPLLLPKSKDICNYQEIAFRNEVSKRYRKKTKQEILEEYRKHHFEEATKVRIQKLAPKPREGLSVLDIGIGWGIVWEDFAEKNFIMGADFSLESLSVLKNLYNIQDVKIEPVCASLDALPFRKNSFDYVFSTQVYQHIRDEKCLVDPLFQVESILKKGGVFVCENINYYPFLLKKIRRPFKDKARLSQIISDRPDFFFKAYRPKEYLSLFNQIFDKTKIISNEIFFHPESKIYTNNKRLAVLDYWFGLLPLLSLFARQLSVICYKK